MLQKGKIGVFDTGLGGLHVLTSIRKLLPDYNYVFYADDARAPYGSKSQQQLYQYAKDAVDFLVGKGCKLIIFACNTVSTNALKRIQDEYISSKYQDTKVLGVVIPAVEQVVESTTGRVGIMATTATVKSNKFVNEITKRKENVKIFQQACPALVPLIEKGEVNGEEMKNVLRQYVRPLLENNIDTLLLGCTHYGVVYDQIKKLAGNNIIVISESEVTPVKLQNYLSRHPEIDSKLERNGLVEHYYSSIILD